MGWKQFSRSDLLARAAHPALSINNPLHKQEPDAALRLVDDVLGKRNESLPQCQ